MLEMTSKSLAMGSMTLLRTSLFKIMKPRSGVADLKRQQQQYKDLDVGTSRSLAMGSIRLVRPSWFKIMKPHSGVADL